MQTDVVVIIRDGGPGSRSWIRSTDSEGQDGGLVEHPEDLPRIVSILEGALQNARAQAGMIKEAAPAGHAVHLQSGTYSTLPTHEQKLRAAELMITDQFTVPAGANPPDGWEAAAQKQMLARAGDPIMVGDIVETAMGPGRVLSAEEAAMLPETHVQRV